MPQASITPALYALSQTLVDYCQQRANKRISRWGAIKFLIDAGPDNLEQVRTLIQEADQRLHAGPEQDPIGILPLMEATRDPSVWCFKGGAAVPDAQGEVYPTDQKKTGC